ncbi:MAG: M56 family metallopeptidase [Muribaculaceae bacterium]|nr:M56 family metallopeptidase [Muribaculaceae bacterium]
MGGFLSYSIISGLLMLAMYLAYRLFLARDNQHGFNRGVLLLIYAVSFMAVPAIYLLDKLNAHGGTLPSATGGIEAVAMAATPHSQPLWGTVLVWIFLSGMIVVTVRTIVTWVRLTNVIRSGKQIEKEGYTLVVTDDERFAPFSWMHYIVLSHKDYDSHCLAIATHELKHVRSRHWIDLLIAQAVCIVNWFNPAAWLMRDELMLVHEYQADMAVIDHGHDPQEYQMLLIKKTVGARFPSLANSLNHSKLKKRITMMYKEKSGAGRKLKALALVPMLALALGVAGMPAVRAAVSTISSCDVSADKGSKNPSYTGTTVQFFKVKNINNNGNATTVTIEGNGFGNNLTVSGGTFTTAGKTYKANGLNCNMTNGEAVITATFPFISVFENTSMTLIINGEEIPFNLEEFFNNAQSVTVGGNNKAITIGLNGKTADLPDDMAILLDGKKISKSEMEALTPGDIASITVDRLKNEIRITSKK